MRNTRESRRAGDEEGAAAWSDAAFAAETRDDPMTHLLDCTWPMEKYVAVVVKAAGSAWSPLSSSSGLVATRH